ncbi:unnamed protein product [Mycena citricolor]|uniref:Uncharacterized protein n=1 Tax=Mycena citricolor TaxID=2018698 RepID=A0AAD2JZJ4_9AGAR|nr:unnamed protein product [Mycena citricolor]
MNLSGGFSVHGTPEIDNRSFSRDTTRALTSTPLPHLAQELPEIIICFIDCNRNLAQLALAVRPSSDLGTARAVLGAHSEPIENDQRPENSRIARQIGACLILVDLFSTENNSADAVSRWNRSTALIIRIAYIPYVSIV